MKECVNLTIPAKSGYVALARMTASNCGAAIGMGIDDINSLRVAVGEAVIYLMVNLPGVVSIKLECESEKLDNGGIMKLCVSPTEKREMAKTLEADDEIVDAIRKNSLSIIRHNVDEAEFEEVDGSISKITMSMGWEIVK